MTRPLLFGLTICLLCEVAAAQVQQPPQSQPGAVTQIGEKIDRGLSQIGAEFSQAWADVRKSVEKMGVQGRVYGRLHWEKSLEGTKFEIGVRDNGVVILSGSVPNGAAKEKAEQLANDTTGVRTVVNELSVASGVAVANQGQLTLSSFIRSLLLPAES